MGEAARLQASLRAAAAKSHEVELVPPFTAFFNPTDALRFHNYAIPDGDVEPARAAVERLRAAFRRRERLPRLEWIEEAAPRVERALVTAGFREELRTPVMACAPDELVEARANVDSLAIAPVADADLRELANVTQTAFGQAPLEPGARPRDPRAHGGGAVAARVAGELVAGAAWTPVVDGVTEIVAVATAERWRRRGLAGAVTGAAATGAFAAGAELCILTPGDETALRVYERAGFRRVATMLHYSDPE